MALRLRLLFRQAFGSSWTFSRRRALSAVVAGATASACALLSLSSVHAFHDSEKEAHSVRAEHADKLPSAVPFQKTAAFAELSALLGENLTLETGELEMHGKDQNSYHEGFFPNAVAFPSTTAEVSSVLRICSRHRLPVIAYGAGTSLEGHTSAPLGGLSLDLSRMDRIVEIHAGDLDCVVQPGVRWADLNDKLKPHGLFFPMDPGPGASIGGMVGTNCSGTNAVKYGSMRDWVLSVTVVLADGTVVKTRRRARKSSAGYDLTRLFVGSEGTLGVVTEVTLKLVPLPARHSVAVVQFPTLHRAADCVIALMRAGTELNAVELLNPLMVRAVNGYSGLSYAELPTLFFKFAGTEPQMASSAQAVRAIADKFGGTAFQWAADQADADRVWEARKGCLWAAESLRASEANAGVWTTDVCVPISRLADCIVETQEDLESAPFPAPIVGHVGDGNFHVFFVLDPSKPEEIAAAQKLNRRLVQRAIAADGTCTGEHGVGLGKKEFLRAELGDPAVDLMVRIKRALDPEGILNPGKIFDAKPAAEKRPARP